MDLKGKVAIVTGGAMGIGKAVSKTFLKKGMKVCVCDVSEAAAKSFMQGLSSELKPNAIFVKCDVSSAEQFRAAFEKTKTTFGKIDVLVNNAGILNEANWKKTVDVNFVGTIIGIQLALEFMGKDKGGSGGFVINTSSRAGIEPYVLGPIYTGTKEGVLGLTKAYGQPYHFEKTGITMNAILPGPIDTPLYQVFHEGTLDPGKANESRGSVTPISPSEVAKGVIQLIQEGKNGCLLRVEEEGLIYADYKGHENYTK